MDRNLLFEYAKDVRKNACTLTGFKVGAALLTDGNRVYTGCNIENAGIQSICAERCAFVKALSNGEKKFKAIFIVGKKDGEEYNETFPCGYCRQFMVSYTDLDFKIYTYSDSCGIHEYTLGELLPHSFDL